MRGIEMGFPGSSNHTAAGEQGLMMLVQAYWVVMVHVPGGGGVEGQVCGVAYHIPAASTTYNTHSVQTWEGRQVDPGTHSMQHKEQPAWGGGGGRGWQPVSRSHYDRGCGVDGRGTWPRVERTQRADVGGASNVTVCSFLPLRCP